METQLLKRVASRFYVSTNVLKSTPFNAVLDQIRHAAEHNSVDHLTVRLSKASDEGEQLLNAQYLAEKLNSPLQRAWVKLRWGIRRLLSQIGLSGKSHKISPPENNALSHEMMDGFLPGKQAEFPQNQDMPHTFDPQSITAPTYLDFPPSARYAWRTPIGHQPYYPKQGFYSPSAYRYWKASPHRPVYADYSNVRYPYTVVMEDQVWRDRLPPDHPMLEFNTPITPGRAHRYGFIADPRRGHNPWGRN